MLWGYIFGSDTAVVSDNVPPVPPVAVPKAIKKSTVAMNNIREYKSHRRSSITNFCKYAVNAVKNAMTTAVTEGRCPRVCLSITQIAKESDVYSDIFGYAINNADLALSDSEIAHITSVACLELQTYGLALSPETAFTFTWDPSSTVIPELSSIHSKYTEKQNARVLELIESLKETVIARVFESAKILGTNYYNYYILNDINAGEGPFSADDIQQIKDSIIEYLVSEDFRVVVVGDVLSILWKAPSGVWYYDNGRCAWVKDE